MTDTTKKTALIVIDVQMALANDDAAGAERSCRQAETNIASLLERFRASGKPIFHVHHHGTDLEDPFHPDLPGAAVQPIAAPKGDEPVVIKLTSSGFVNTPLNDMLKNAGVDQAILCGATANHCVESTTRSACDLGYDPIYVGDAVWAYGVTGPDGKAHSGEAMHSVVMATLDGEIAKVMTTEQVLAQA